MDRDPLESREVHRKSPACTEPLLPGSSQGTTADAHDELLAGRFLLRRRLGEGGMGEVFSAVDTALGQPVAVKVVHPQCAGPHGRQRLAREVLAARHRHPGLVEIYDLHETDGRIFLSMELVEGPSLAEALRGSATLPVQTVVLLGQQLAGTLLHLHRHGLIHRDLKPANVLLSPDGGAKLCDLGLASPVPEGEGTSIAGETAGTPGYMAPEQLAGESLTPAADLYALGLTLYRCLTGWVPRQEPSGHDVDLSRGEGRPPAVRRSRPECPVWLDDLVLRLLDPDPTRRPTADDVARTLAAGGRGPASLRRLAAAVIAVVLAGAAFVSCRSLSSSRSAPPPTHAVASQASLSRV
jgi:serine/threonine protein kinase